MTKKKKYKPSSIEPALCAEALEAKLAAWMQGAEKLPPLGSTTVADAVFEENNEEIVFPPDLTPKERRLVHMVAGHAGLYHITVEELGLKRVCVSRHPKDVIVDPNAILKPCTPHAALRLCKEEMDALKRQVLAPLNFADEMHKRQIEAVVRAAAFEDDIANCSANILTNAAIFVDTVDGLYAVADHIRRYQEFAFDLEMHSERSYHGITCLIQIAVRRNGLLGSFPYESTDYVIDCIALWGHIGPALGALFADPDVLKVGHALHMDISALFRDFAIIMRSVFDTQVAWAVLFDSTSGSDMVGLAPLLSHFNAPDNSAKNMMQIKHDLSMYDWRTRPLPPHALQYAQMDVHLLLPTAYIMIKKLVEKASTETVGGLQADALCSNFEFVDMVFFSSQSNASKLWSPKKPIERASVWASGDYLERDGTECGAEHASSVNSLCTESSPKTGNTYSNGVLTGSSCAANVVHVHISGSRNKLGHDLKARRRATRKKLGSYGSIMWRTDINVLVAQRLLEWRNRVGIDLDESPAYVCPSALVLKIAENKPTDLRELYQVWSPLPPILLKLQIDCRCNDKIASPTSGDECKCVTSVVRAAVTEYNNVVQEFLATKATRRKCGNNATSILGSCIDGVACYKTYFYLFAVSSVMFLVARRAAFYRKT